MSIKIWGALLLLAVISPLGSQPTIQEEESNEIAYASLPSAVRSAAETILGAGVLGSSHVELEVEDGITSYEVESRIDGRGFSLKFSEAGDLMEAERSIDFDDLPEAVRRELSAAFPSQSFAEVEQIERHFFELEFGADGREYEIRVSPAGRIQHLSREDPE